MPAAGSLRVPVVIRSEVEYRRLLAGAGFSVEAEALYPSEKVLHEKPGLRYAKGIPLALAFDCEKRCE